MVRHSTGVYYFGERENLDNPTAVSAEHIREMLALLRVSYRYVVLDLPHTFDATTQEAFDASDTILLVATADVASVRAAKYTLRALGTAGYDDHRIKVLVNRTSRKNAISTTQFSQTIGHAVDYEVPNDYQRVIDAINTGEPFVLTDKKCDLTRSIVTMADSLRAAGNHSVTRAAMRTPMKAAQG